MSRNEPARLSYPLGESADSAALPETSDTVASLRALFPYLTQVPVDAGGAYPRREDMNALIKKIGADLYFLESGHVWSYDATRLTDYAPGDLVWYDAGADIYASLPVSDGHGGYTSELVLLSAVTAAAGYPAGASLLFVRNSAAYTSGAGDPVITQDGQKVVNAAYWEPVLTLEQYARLWYEISTHGSAAVLVYATDAQVWALFSAVSPVIQIDTSALAAGVQAYIYIVDGDGQDVTAAYPGDPLIMIGESRSVFDSTLLPDAAADYSLVISAGGEQTGTITWSTGALPLEDARGHYIGVTAGSNSYTVIE